MDHNRMTHCNFTVDQPITGGNITPTNHKPQLCLPGRWSEEIKKFCLQMSQTLFTIGRHGSRDEKMADICYGDVVVFKTLSWP